VSSVVESDLMGLPWLGVIDTLLNVTSLVVGGKAHRPADEPEPFAVAGRSAGQLEARMTGVVVAALREAFDRDARRLELEREQADREHLRGRLRLMAGVAVGSWIGTVFFAARLAGGPPGARVMLGAGWLLLLVALSLSFAAQARVGEALVRIDDAAARHDGFTAGAAGAVVPGLIVMGLAVIGLAVLIST